MNGGTCEPAASMYLGKMSIVISQTGRFRGAHSVEALCAGIGRDIKTGERTEGVHQYTRALRREKEARTKYHQS